MHKPTCTDAGARGPNPVGEPWVSIKDTKYNNPGCPFTNLRTQAHTVVTFVRSKIVIRDLHATNTNSKWYKSK